MKQWKKLIGPLEIACGVSLWPKAWSLGAYVGRTVFFYNPAISTKEHPAYMVKLVTPFAWLCFEWSRHP